MIMQSDHRESWTVTLGREPHDKWPDIETGYSRKRVMRPDQVSFTLRRGDNRMRAAVKGVGYLKNGEPGRQEITEHWPEKIPWVMALVREVRGQLHLGPDTTGVPW